MRPWPVFLILMGTSPPTSAAPDAEVQVLLQKAQGELGGERISALRRLTELDSAPQTPKLIPQLAGLEPGQAETDALLGWWLARPYGATAAATGAWVVKVLNPAPTLSPGVLPRLSERGPKDRSFQLAARLLAARPQTKEAQEGLVVLVAYPDEEVARTAATGLLDAPRLEVKAGPALLQALEAGDPVLESRALQILAKHPEPKLTEGLLRAAEGASARGTSEEYLPTLRALTKQKFPTVAAYRAWWSRQAPSR